MEQLRQVEVQRDGFGRGIVGMGALLDETNKRAEAAEKRRDRLIAAFFGISLRLSGIDQREITLEEIAEIAKEALRG